MPQRLETSLTTYTRGTRDQILREERRVKLRRQQLRSVENTVQTNKQSSRYKSQQNSTRLVYRLHGYSMYLAQKCAMRRQRGKKAVAQLEEMRYPEELTGP